MRKTKPGCIIIKCILLYKKHVASVVPNPKMKEVIYKMDDIDIMKND